MRMAAELGSRQALQDRVNDPVAQAPEAGIAFFALSVSQLQRLRQTDDKGCIVRSSAATSFVPAAGLGRR